MPALPHIWLPDDELPPAPVADRPARRASDGCRPYPAPAASVPDAAAPTSPVVTPIIVIPPPVTTVVPEIPAGLRRLLASRGADGVTVRDALRARLAPDADAVRTLLDELARTGELTRQEQRPTHGGKVIVAYHLPETPAHP